jgi:hypothetical protein
MSPSSCRPPPTIIEIDLASVAIRLCLLEFLLDFAENRYGLNVARLMFEDRIPASPGGYCSAL